MWHCEGFRGGGGEPALFYCSRFDRVDDDVWNCATFLVLHPALVLGPSCVHEKAAVNQKGVNKT